MMSSAASPNPDGVRLDAIDGLANDGAEVAYDITHS